MVNRSESLDGQLVRLSGLAERQRRRLYITVAASQTPMSRDDAAAAVGISRSLTAYHLDRLVEDGLLEVSFERRSGRSGPGAGRPAKLYRRSATPVEVNVPAREYAFLAELLASAIEADCSGAASASLLRVARAAGGSALEETASSGRRSGPRALSAVLADLGYEPFADAEGTVRLRNCPFHRLAGTHRQLVCGANLAFIQGLADRLASAGSPQPQLDPQPELCCVAVPRDRNEPSGSGVRGQR
jgi:predicted ArsR family transcriptional regulator